MDSKDERWDDQRSLPDLADDFGFYVRGGRKKGELGCRQSGIRFPGSAKIKLTHGTALGAMNGPQVVAQAQSIRDQMTNNFYEIIVYSMVYDTSICGSFAHQFRLKKLPDNNLLQQTYSEL